MQSSVSVESQPIFFRLLLLSTSNHDNFRNSSSCFLLDPFWTESGKKNIAKKKRKRHKLFRYIYISGNTFLLRYVQTRDPTVTLTHLYVFCVKWLRSCFEIYSHASCMQIVYITNAARLSSELWRIHWHAQKVKLWKIRLIFIDLNHNLFYKPAQTMEKEQEKLKEILCLPLFSVIYNTQLQQWMLILNMTKVLNKTFSVSLSNPQKSSGSVFSTLHSVCWWKLISIIWPFLLSFSLLKERRVCCFRQAVNWGVAPSLSVR